MFWLEGVECIVHPYVFAPVFSCGSTRFVSFIVERDLTGSERSFVKMKTSKSAKPLQGRMKDVIQYMAMIEGVRSRFVVLNKT